MESNNNPQKARYIAVAFNMCQKKKKRNTPFNNTQQDVLNYFMYSRLFIRKNSYMNDETTN